MADQLATKADLDAALQTTTTNATATLLLETATAIVQSIARQRIVQVVGDVVTLALDDLDGGYYLYLPEGPVTAVSSITVNGTALSASDYTTYLSRGRVYRSSGWRSSTAVVTYTHGYAPGDQKLQLARAAVLSLAKAAYSNPTGATQIRIDDYAATYEAMSAGMQASEFLTGAIRRTYGRTPGSAVLVAS